MPGGGAGRLAPTTMSGSSVIIGDVLNARAAAVDVPPPPAAAAKFDDVLDGFS